ncbi:MAG: hypothetical protein EOP06_27280 [Proteobacteria bacterium]|nr:MAG: hypothetical protein EOP06_27280 [Pseudomonadota bacterium]
MEPFDYFVDEMLVGHFKSFRHEHWFAEIEGITTMTDHIVYKTPYGIIGRVFDWLILRNYMLKLIEKRNAVIAQIAENAN